MNVIGVLLAALAVVWSSTVFATTLDHTEPDGTVIHAEISGKIVTITGSHPTDPRFDKQELRVVDDFGTYDPVTNTRTVRYHGGGSIYAMALVLKQANARGEHIRLLCDRFNFMTMRTGCVSATTFFTGANNVCVGPNAVTHWHGAGDGMVVIRHDITPFLARLLPVPLRKPFVGWTKQNELHMATVRKTHDDLKLLWPAMKTCK